MKILIDDKELDERLNGHVIHTIDLTSSDLIIEKNVTIEKISLSESDGSLTEKTKLVLKSMFK
jgi:hypothetical protein